MIHARYSWRNRIKDRTEEDVKADIEELKKTSSERIDMAMLDRRAYCLTNSIVATEGELPIYEKQIAALEEMPEEVKLQPYWVLNHTLLKHRLEEAKLHINKEREELAAITEQLKNFDFETGRKKFDTELKELKELEEEVKEAEKEGPAIAAGWSDEENKEGKPDAVALDKTAMVEVPEPSKEE